MLKAFFTKSLCLLEKKSLFVESCSYKHRKNCECCPGHSRCLESLCGDFLYIAVLVIGATRRSRDYYTDNHLLRCYVCTTNTCNVSGCILLRRQRRIISSTDWQRCPDQAGAGFPRMQLRLRHLARFLVACTLCINSEKAWLVLLSVQRFCAVCKTFARLIMIV